MMKLAAWTAVLALALGACSDSVRQERRWTEDVRLEDGTIVEIERHVVFHETDALGGGAYNAVESKATLQFAGDLAALPAWDYPRIALVLYRSADSRAWRIVATTNSCTARYPGERGPYTEYELQGTQWQRIPLHPDSIGRPANLFFNYHSTRFGEHVTVGTKEQLQSDRRIADFYRAILADPKDFHCM